MDVLAYADKKYAEYPEVSRAYLSWVIENIRSDNQKGNISDRQAISYIDGLFALLSEIYKMPSSYNEGDTFQPTTVIQDLGSDRPYFMQWGGSNDTAGLKDFEISGTSIKFLVDDLDEADEIATFTLIFMYPGASRSFELPGKTITIKNKPSQGGSNTKPLTIDVSAYTEKKYSEYPEVGRAYLSSTIESIRLDLQKGNISNEQATQYIDGLFALLSEIYKLPSSYYEGDSFKPATIIQGLGSSQPYFVQWGGSNDSAGSKDYQISGTTIKFLRDGIEEGGEIATFTLNFYYPGSTRSFEIPGKTITILDPAAKNVVGGPGSDTLSGGPGNDVINGGDGIDFFIAGGARSLFTLSQNDPGWNLVDKSDVRGNDTLIKIERVLFSDLRLALDLAPNDNAGQALLLIGAVLGRDLTLLKRPLLGTVIDLFDQGYTIQQLAGALMRLPIWAGTLTLTNSNTDIATYLLTRVNGKAPTPAELSEAVKSLEGDVQGTFLANLALTQANISQVDLVGIAKTGFEYPLGG